MRDILESIPIKQIRINISNTGIFQVITPLVIVKSFKSEGKTQFHSYNVDRDVVLQKLANKRKIEVTNGNIWVNGEPILSDPRDFTFHDSEFMSRKVYMTKISKDDFCGRTEHFKFTRDGFVRGTYANGTWTPVGDDINSNTIYYGYTAKHIWRKLFPNITEADICLTKENDVILTFQKQLDIVCGRIQ